MAIKKCEECGKEVSTEAEMCPSCGIVIKKKGSGVFKWVLGIFLGLVTFVLISPLMNNTLSLKHSSSHNTPSIENDTVTLEKYKQIQDGMSYKKVVSIIGTEGEEMSRNKIDGVPGVMQSIETVMYSWRNESRSGMTASFQNDKLKLKAQHGLK